MNYKTVWNLPIKLTKNEKDFNKFLAFFHLKIIANVLAVDIIFGYASKFELLGFG